jgi:hypothetical protein
LIFADPSGVVHRCPVFVGKYSPDAFAEHLEREMTRLAQASLPGCVFSVHFDHDQSKFVFSCEHRDDIGTVSPAKFTMILNHPAQFDPARIGFPPTALYGSDTYVSSSAVEVAHHRGRSATNVYRVAEIGHQKRLRIQPCPIPAMNAVVVNYYDDDSVVHVRTHVHSLPFAHGLQLGDILSIGKAQAATLVVWSPEHQKWQAADFEAAPIVARYGKSAVVVDAPRQRASCSQELTPFDLFLRVKNTRTLLHHLNAVIRLSVEVQPLSVCFSKDLKRSLKSEMLGFREGSTQWGIDGSVPNIHGHLLPPFEAPRVFSMDHPDYVLMFIAQGKKGLAIHHVAGACTTTPFAKIVLYPMFREERMLPRETTFVGSEKMSLLTVSFTNPDGTAYHFHGVNFSFSLNFLV